MSKVGRNAWVAKAHPQVITGDNFTRQTRIHKRLTRQNDQLDNDIEERRKEWTFVPPSNHTIILYKDQGQVPAGLVLSVPHEIGCMILHKRLGRIIERDGVAIDVLIVGDVESAVEAMSLLAMETA